MSSSPPWDDLSALLPSPSTLPPTPADLSAQLPSHFITALHSSRPTFHSPSPPPPPPAIPHATKAAAAASLGELLPHFRRLLSSPAALRAALAGRADDETLWVTDATARKALAELLDRLRHVSSFGAEERATWLAGMEIGDELVDAGGESARHANDSVRQVFEKVRDARERVKSEADAERERGE